MATRAITDFKVCEECNGPCEFIECKARPLSAEWYCSKCHRSYLARVEEDEAPKRKRA